MATPASTTAIRLPGNLTFGAGGMSIDFLVGTFVKQVAEDELTGVVTIHYQDGDGDPQTATLDGSLLINAAPDADPQPVANETTLADRRVWWDGVTLKRVVRTPGHGLQVTWPSYASASYRGEFRDNPPNFENNQFYYHLGARNFVYRINGHNVGGTPSGWRGHVSSEAAATALVTADGQIFEWNDNVHISENYQNPINANYFWEPVSVASHALSQAESEDEDSEVQGTVSGQRLSQAVGAMEPEAFRDAIRYGLVVFQDRDPTASDFTNNRVFFDGIVARKVRRVPVPEHDRIVAFREDNLQLSLYGTGIYVDRNAADSVPGTPNVGERYFNRNRNHWEIWEAGNYWNTSQFIAAPQDADGSLWIGEFGNENLADSHVDRVGQVASYPDDGGIYVLHRVDSITAQTDDNFRYELEPIFGAYALDNAEIDNAESDVQGTISGRGLTRAVEQHSPFTDVEQDILDDLSRLTFPHPDDDWQIRQTYSTRDFFANQYSTFLSLGWDADNRLRALSGDGHVARLGGHDRGRIYDGAETLRAGLVSGSHWLFMRDNAAGSAIERAPVDGGDDDTEFQIVLRYFSMFADPDSGTLLGILRRVSATDMEVGLLAYDATAGTITAEDTITLTRAHIDAALGADFAPLTDIHRESASGAYQDVAGAILEGETLYLILTDIAKVDGHTASVLVGFTLAGTPNNRSLTVLAENAVTELPIADELTSGILPLEADELFLARDTAVYRLSPRPEEVVVEETAWGGIQDRPNRPSAEEIIEGTSVDEAVPSVSDVVAIGNAHVRHTLSNADPEDVGNEAAEGTSGPVSREGHVHRFPHNNTIQYDETAENFGINIHDVTEHTGQTIRYFTNEDTFTNGGGLSEGQIYSTSGFRKLITKVQLQTSNILGAHFRARIKTVDADRNITGDLGRSYAVNPGSTNPHSYPFFDADGNVGILEEGNQRIAIILEGDEAGDTPALRYGDQESDSPGESYPDASVDFHLENDVVYADRDPAIGQHSHSHGNRIRGNIKIFYQLIYGHDDLGSEIEPSDAVPQPNTEDGSAGDLDDYSRANHAHPGTAGGSGGAATLGGNTAETLFDNRASTETALAVNAGVGSALLSADIPLSRAIAEADDAQDLRCRFIYTQDGQIRSMDVTLNAGIFRNFVANNSGVGSVLPVGGYHIFATVDPRTGRRLSSLFSRAAILVRGSVATGDVIRIYLNTTSNAAVAVSEMRGVVELVPRIDALTISGGGGTALQGSGSASLGAHTEIVLWQYSPPSVRPPSPPNPWHAVDQTYLADIGDWHTTDAAALAARVNNSDALWVAHGGVDNPAGGTISNRAWSIFAVAAHQYSGDRGATNHATRQTSDNAYRFLRPNGTWSAWLSIADNPYGFVGLLFAIEAHSTSSITSRYSGIPSPGFDATNFPEMALRMRAFGDYATGDVPTTFGIEDTVILRRRGTDWSEFTDVTNDRTTQAESTVKLRLDDVSGAVAAWYGGGATNDQLEANVHSGVTGQPERRMSMNMNILVSSSNANLIQGVSFHHFPDNWAKCLVDVSMR